MPVIAGTQGCHLSHPIGGQEREEVVTLCCLLNGIIIHGSLALQTAPKPFQRTSSYQEPIKGVLKQSCHTAKARSPVTVQLQDLVIVSWKGVTQLE